MKKEPNLIAFTVRLPPEDYSDLLFEADQGGVPLATYARSILIQRGQTKPQKRISGLDLNKDFAESLATALAIIIITGAVTTEGLERSVEETTLEILQSLGAA